MYCIIIIDAHGKYHREVEETLPAGSDLYYWEDHYRTRFVSAYDGKESYENAVVVNVFQIEKE